MSDPISRLNAALTGRYEVERELGEGGMATVYLAEDLRHERKVALKVLKPELAAVVGAERFLAEIKTTANLQHPHILPLFDSGEADGFLFYVMPYVEGESLRDRLDREGQLPVEEAVRIATDVSEALDYAHAQGVVHRDIKPANILIQAGKPVVSDFGIALAVSVGGAGRLTETGLSLGTPHYMSPEQATGDQRVGPGADIYALACVLYEMLVGEPPFTGSSPQAILGKIITGDVPSASGLRPSVPENVDATLRRALEKLPADRFLSARHFRESLADPSFASAAGLPRTSRSMSRWSAIGWGTLGALTALAGVALTETFESAEQTYLPIRTPPGVALAYDLANHTVAVAPDGRGVVYVGFSDRRRLYWQDLRQPGDAREIEGTEGALAPFFSPDGNWVGFFAGNRLQKVSLGGGAPVELATVAIHRGGTWSADGESIFYTPTLRSGIMRIPADGGEPVEITEPGYDGEDEGHWLPVALPDGDGLLYTRCCANFTVMHADVEGGISTPVLRNAFGARYARSGHLLFAQGGSLMAARFDVDDLTVGNPVAIRDDLITGHELQAEFGFSEDGTFAYLAGPSWWERRLIRVDRSSGRIERLTEEPQAIILDLKLSPSSDRVVLTLMGSNSDIIEFDLARRAQDRITSDRHNDFSPVWTSDSRRAVFSSTREGGFDLFTSDVSGSGQPRLLHPSDEAQWAHSWSPGDSLLVLTRDRPETGWDILVLDVASGEAEVFRDGPSNEGRAVFSPDGRFLAYASDRSGTFEIYVDPFPGPGEGCQVSVGGGDDPRWASNGELFYLSGSTVMGVAPQGLSPVCAPDPTPIVDGVQWLTWDVSHEADFFVTVEQRPEPRLFLALNFFDELKRLVPN